MDQEQDTTQAEPGEEQRETIVRVENLSKAYSIPNGKLRVLQDIHLEVKRAEFVAVAGPSGSGKTTLLSLLGALDSLDSGQIWLDDIAVHRLRGTAAADFRRQQVGFVFQLFYLLPNLTALENVMEAPVHVFGESVTAARERATALLTAVGLGHVAHHLPQFLGQAHGAVELIIAVPRLLRGLEQGHGRLGIMAVLFELVAAGSPVYVPGGERERGRQWSEGSEEGAPRR